MVAHFKRARSGVLSVTFDATESRLLRHVFTEMLELLGDPASDVEDDPLAAAVGIGTSTEAPEDPALARLFPDGYTDDSDASADFRRYTEPGLRAQKRVALQTAVAMLGEGGQRLQVTDDEASAWLRALNDTRLVLGQRLDVTEDWDEVVESLAADDPRLPMFWVYDRLTYLEESLVQALW
ncbi:MAG TPA: DUF2017 domain-containing protein [Actinomycetes bacterium]|nr:DUF2017 domain-containing protein [Actinomycetes bacterium]